MSLITPAGYGELCLLPVPPKAGYTETLRWATDIIDSYNGGEERISLRAQPLQSFRADHQGTFRYDAEFFHAIYGDLSSAWAVPVWSEGQYAGTLAAAATGAAVGSSVADLRAGSLALLYGARGAYAVVVLTTVGASAITFPAIASEIKSAYVFPLRVGRLTSSPTRRSGDMYSLWNINYEVRDGIEFSPAAPDQFLGNDIYFDEIFYDSDHLSTKITGGVERVDFGIGAVYAESPWTNNRVAHPYNVTTRTAEEAWAFRMWLHRRRGKYRSFWQPSFHNDLTLYADSYPTPSTLGSIIGVWTEGFYNHALGRTHLAFEDMNGNWVVRTITETSDGSGANMNITLDDSVGIESNELRRICFLGLKRLDTDTVDLRWIGNGVMDATIPVIEISP
jgi:hypothetical protein